MRQNYVVIKFCRDQFGQSWVKRLANNIFIKTWYKKGIKQTFFSFFFGGSFINAVSVIISKLGRIWNLKNLETNRFYLKSKQNIECNKISFIRIIGVVQACFTTDLQLLIQNKTEIGGKLFSHIMSLVSLVRNILVEARGSEVMSRGWEWRGNSGKWMSDIIRHTIHYSDIWDKLLIGRQRQCWPLIGG